MMSFLYDCHIHTFLSRHASGEPGQYAEAAVAAGLKGIIFTCHAPVPREFNQARMQLEELPSYISLVDNVRDRWKGELDVLLGLESDYVAGMNDWVEKLHAMAQFDFILGSVHPFAPWYGDAFRDGTPEEIQRRYFRLIGDAAESKLFDALAHLDLIKCFFSNTWDRAGIQDSIADALDRIAAAGTAIEVNTSGLHKSYRELQPGPIVLREARKRGIAVTIGSDAHEPGRVGEGFPAALDALKQAAYTHAVYFRQRVPCEVVLP